MLTQNTRRCAGPPSGAVLHCLAPEMDGPRWLKPTIGVASSSKLTVSRFNERKRAAALKLDRGGCRASATPYLRITSHLGCWVEKRRRQPSNRVEAWTKRHRVQKLGRPDSGWTSRPEAIHIKCSPSARRAPWSSLRPSSWASRSMVEKPISRSAAQIVTWS